MKKRLFATLLALVMALGLTATAWADDSVTYVDADGTTKTCTNYTTVTDDDGSVTWNAGWYVVKDNVTIGNSSPNYGYLTVTGEVHLILCDDATLEVKGSLFGDKINSHIYGIRLESGASLTVYGQSDGTGTLDVSDAGYAYYPYHSTINPSVSIGIALNSGRLTINGGHVMAGSKIPSGGKTYGLYGGTLNMNGGKLTANSYKSSDIANNAPIEDITIESDCYKWRTDGMDSYMPSSTQEYTPASPDPAKEQKRAEIVAGHEFDDLVPATPATCTEPGTVAHKTCAICGKHFDADGNVIADENLTIPATGHASPLTHVPAKPATRQEAGNIEYWQCSKCQQCFTDEAGQTPIDQADTVIAKLPPKKTPSTPATPAETVASPKTADPGVLLSAALSVVSLLGMGYVGKKR